MSTVKNDRFLKIATGVAIVALIIGGAMYMGGLLGPATSVPPAMDKPTETQVTTRAASQAPAGLEGVKAPRGPSLMEMATRPKILPGSELAAVRPVMEAMLPDVETCWHQAVGDSPSRDAKVFVKFEIGAEARAAGLEVESKGIGKPVMHECIKGLFDGYEFPGAAEGTTVFWPVILDPDSGVSLTEPL